MPLPGEAGRPEPRLLLLNADLAVAALRQRHSHPVRHHRTDPIGFGCRIIIVEDQLDEAFAERVQERPVNFLPAG
jgi:hypothetical protein